MALAGELQSARGAADDADAAAGAGASLPRDRWPAALTPRVVEFSIDASVLQLAGDDLRFTHQLLQEALASRLFLQASRSASTPASRYWPPGSWWQRTGWEVVAQLAAEACGADGAALSALLAWLAAGQPRSRRRRLAPRRLAGARPRRCSTPSSHRWLARMTDPAAEPEAAARAAIGRALGRFGLDARRGVGLRADGLPDIDWVAIPGGRPFVYQDGERLTIPAFDIARFPVTHAQFQAFVDAGGYGDERWWQGLAEQPPAPEAARWDEPNSPRETVNWFEAVAFCRWLGAATGKPVALPTERQWERAARGTDGREYPWGDGWRPGHANCDESGEGRATHVPRKDQRGRHLPAGRVAGGRARAGRQRVGVVPRSARYDGPGKSGN